MKNANVPDKLLPEDHKVVGYEGPDFDHLVVFVSEENRNTTMTMAEFRREQLTRDKMFYRGDHCVIPADKDGKLLYSDDKAGELIKGVWGYNPLAE